MGLIRKFLFVAAIFGSGLMLAVPVPAQWYGYGYSPYYGGYGYGDNFGYGSPYGRFGAGYGGMYDGFGYGYGPGNYYTYDWYDSGWY